jgi:ABC-2 type transport system permease protein
MAIETVSPMPTDAGSGRPAVGHTLRAVGIVARRELIRLRRMPGRVVSGLAQPLLYLFVLGAGLANLVGHGGINGATYQQYIFPGVIAMSVIASSVFAAIAIVWDREFGFMREMLVAPVSRAVLVGGKAAGGIVVAVAQGLVLIVLAPLADVPLSVGKVLGLLGALVLLAYAMTAVGILLASRMRRLESFQMVMALALQPMIFLSGAIFPLERLPGWFAVLCAVNPAAYGVDLARRALLGSEFALTVGDHVVPVWADVAILVAVGSVLLVAATRILGTVE